MTFNAEAFMASTVTEVNSTKVTPWPVADYTVQIKKIAARGGTVTKQGANFGNNWASLNLTVELPKEFTPPGCNSQLTSSIMLDLNESGTGLDMGEGKNVKLGRLREAAGLNVPGQPFNPLMFEGRTVVASVGQRVDETDPSIIYNEFKNFRKP